MSSELTRRAPRAIRSEPRIRQALRPAQAAKKMGISLPTFWRWARENPRFPKLRKIGERTTVVMDDDLDEFMASAE
jgi:prophage regulatory protein